MMDENLVLLEYCDNFADNFSNYAYGKIYEKEKKAKCFFENNPRKRKRFEDKMKYFSIEPNYLSSSRFNNIIKNSAKNLVCNKHFKTDDIKYLDDDILKCIKFDKLDFIVNYDVLDEITARNSIGVYLNSSDINNNKIDWDFIDRACARLNKYLKNPVLFIFTDGEIEHDFFLDFEYKILNELNWKENFYFLSRCKHSIIPENSSYSLNFWSSLLADKSYSLKIIQKNNNRKYKPDNWIEI